MMQKNVGTTDALIRITGGLLGLAYGIGRMSRRPYNTPWLLMGFSAIKVAEGITRHCLMYRALGIDTHSEKGMQNVLGNAKNKGVQMVMNQVARTLNNRKNEETVTNSAAPARQESGKSSGHRLSPEDEQLEKAAREFVSNRSSEDNELKSSASADKNQSDTYSQDEHRYPTYS